MSIINWSKLGTSSSAAMDNFKMTLGSEIVESLMSIPDTVAFIEFIYEEAAQTALFAIYQAHKNGQDEMARQILDYLQFQLLPDAVGMVASWGALNPATQNCFQRFFEAVRLAATTWDQILTIAKPSTATLVIYTNVNDVDIYVDGKYKGSASPTVPFKAQLEPGSYGIEAKKNGYQTEARQVKLSTREYQVMKINMKPLT